MSELDSETDCYCEEKVSLGFDERGELIGCVKCGSYYISSNDDLKFVEDEE